MDVYLLVEILLGLINLIICFSLKTLWITQKRLYQELWGRRRGGVQKQQQQQKQKDKERGIFKGGDVTTQFYYVLCASPFITIACFFI